MAAAAVGALVLAPLVGIAPALAAPDGNDVVINEVYARGGSANQPYTHKFVELHNPSDREIALDGLTLQYRSASGTGESTTLVQLTGSIAADGYYLIQAGSNGATGSALPTPDASEPTLNIQGSNATLALVRGTSAATLPTGDVVGATDYIVDLVGTGSSNTWEGSGTVETSGGNSVPQSVTRTDGIDTDDNAQDFTIVASPTPQSSGGSGDPGGPGEDTCGDVENPVALISDIQGSGAAFDPTCAGEQTVVAVVTAIKTGLSGFYIQEEAADSDGDPTSSEGIFVFVGGAGIPAGLEVGQSVRVTGTVAEFTSSGSSQTQLTNPAVQIIGDADTAIDPVAVTFPVETPSTLEQYEGMLVELTDTLVISEYFNYDRFGEVVLAKPLEGQDRLHTPTAVVEPGPAAQALFAEYERRIITLDDYNSSQNPVEVPHPGDGEEFSAENTFRGGDTVTGVEGVIDETFGLYRIQPTDYGEYVAVNPRPTEPPEVGGRIQVASFNVLNYFLTVDDGVNDICGADQKQECRGADTAAELERQRTKILGALAELDGEVVGLMEMENTPGVEPAANLVAGLNQILGAGTYAYIDTGVIGTDAIRLGFLYKPGVVTPVGDFEVLDTTDDPRFLDTENRPMLTQTFDEVATGERFTVSVNHLKSKGSDCGPLDPDEGDGQGNCNLTRVAAAESIVDFLAGDPTGSGDPDHLVIGDLNSYDHEDPIDVFIKARYTDLVREFGGDLAYGYVFDGMVGYLDHALANNTLTPQVAGASEWHINADEPDILDYNLDFGRPADYFTADPYRSSDHDPVLVGLELDSVPPSLKVELSHHSLWPANHKYVTVTADVTATDNSGVMPTVKLVSVTSNEPDNGRGDGNTVNDIVCVKNEKGFTNTFKLRAERSGSGDGRIYTVTYRATDSAGNGTTTTATVTVPLSKRR